jgi:hypothetical protein
MAINIREGLFEDIKGKLDNNTEGQIFDSSLDIKVDVERLGYFQLEKNFQTEEQGTVFVEYTPAGMLTEETPSGVKDIDKSTWNIQYLFWLTGTDDSDTDFSSQKKAIEELRLQLNNNSLFTVSVGTTTYNCKSIATSLTKIEDIRPLAGYKRIVMSMGITVISGIGIKFGDNEIFEIQKQLSEGDDFTFTELNVNRKDTATSIEYNSSQPKGDDIAKGVPNKAIWQSTISLPYNDSLLAHRYLYDVGMDNDSFDDIIELKVTKPNTGVINKNVNTQVKIASITGVDIMLVVTFTEATTSA